MLRPQPPSDSLADQLDGAAVHAAAADRLPSETACSFSSSSSSLDGALDDVASAADEPQANVPCDAASAAAADDSRQWASDADERSERPPRQQQQQQQPLVDRSSSTPLLDCTSTSVEVAGGSCQRACDAVADRALLAERQPSFASAQSPSPSLDGCANLADHGASSVYAADDRRPSPNGPDDSPNLAADASSRHVGKVVLQQQSHSATEVPVLGLGHPAIAEEYIVRVRGLVMERDKATDLWAPGRHYPWCIVGLLQRHACCTADCRSGSDATCSSSSEGTGLDQVGADSPELSSGASPLEYVIRGRRLHDSEEIISCTVNSGLQYSVANPTFHHWTATDGTNRGCGVLFVNASDAARFEKHVRRALSHVSSCQVVLPKKNAATIADGTSHVARAAPAAVSETLVSRSEASMLLSSPAVASANFPVKAIAVNGGAVAPVEESGGGNNNNSWPPISGRLPPPPFNRGSHHHLAASAAAADASSPALATKAVRSPQVTEFVAPHRAAARTSSDDGLSAMYDYRTGELPGILPTSAASCCADSGAAAGSATLCRSRRAYTQVVPTWPLTDGDPRPQQSLQRWQQPQQQSVPSRANAPRDYRQVDGVEARRALPVDDFDSHLVELKLPTRATKAPGRRRPRFALPRVRQLCCLASSEENGGDNQPRRPSANGRHATATFPLAKRSHDHRSCCKRVGQCFGDDGALPSDGGCDDNVEVPPPSPPCRKEAAGRRGGGVHGGSPVARLLRRLFCSCWCLPNGGSRGGGSADRHRLRSSVSSASSSSTAERLRGQFPVDNSVLSPPPSRRLTT